MSAFACLRAGAAQQPQSLLQRLPLAFEVNRGQSGAPAAFVAHRGGLALYMTEGGAVLALSAATARAAPARAPAEVAPPWTPRWLDPADLASAVAPPQPGIALRYAFAGANVHPRIEGVGAPMARSNYLIGSDPGAWRTDIPLYRAVRYRDVLPGTDIVYYGNGSGVEFDVELAPGADLAQVRLRIEGSDAVALDAGGNIALATMLGTVVQHKPRVYQIAGGIRRELDGAYVLVDGADGRREIAFDVPGWDRASALVLDPLIEFGAYLGGDAYDTIGGLAVDAAGDIYVAGRTQSAAASFPWTVGAFQTTKAAFTDAYVVKIKGDGSQLLWATYVGGNGNDYADSLDVDASGQAVLSGETGSSDYPRLNATQTSVCGGTCAIVTKLDAAGSGLVFSTYYGGNQVTQAFGVASDTAGNTYVTGRSIFNTTFPTTPGAFQTALVGQSNAFVAKYGPSGTQVYSTLLGAGTEEAFTVLADADGSAYVVGDTSAASINGVTANLIGPGGFGDILIAKLDVSGSALDYLTRIGGSSSEQGTGAVLDPSGNVWFTGHSFSSDLPSTPAAPGGTNVALFGALDARGLALTGPGLTWYGDTAPFDPTCATGGAFGSDIALDAALSTATIVGYGCPASTFPELDPIPDFACAPNCAKNGSFLVTYGRGDPPALPGAPRNPTALPAWKRRSSTRIAPMSTEAYIDRVKERVIASIVASMRRYDTVAAGSSSGAIPAQSSFDTSPNGGVDTTVYAIGQNAQPPLVGKYFAPTFATVGQTVTMGIVIANPNEDTEITHFAVQDTFPSCLKQVKSLSIAPKSCKSVLGAIDADATSIALPAPGSTITLPPKTVCTLKLQFQLLGGAPCVNQTSAATSDQGNVDPATATVLSLATITRTWKGSGAQAPPSAGRAPSVAGSMSDSANWIGAAVPGDGDDVLFPAGVTPTAVTNDLPAQRFFNLVQLAGPGYALGGNAFNLVAGIANTASGNAVSAQIHAREGIIVSSDPANATLSLGGGLVLDGTEAYFVGAGTTTLASAATGTGAITISGPGDVLVSAAPAFSGTITVGGGRFLANAAVAQAVDVGAGGVLGGTGPFTGSVTIEGGGLLYPGNGAAPFTLPVNVLDVDRGRVGLRFSADNSAHSAVSASGAVTLVGALALDFGSVPGVNATYGSLITAPGTISGCFDEVRAMPPNVVAAVQCTASAVSVQVKAIDRLFAGSFDY